VKRSSRSTSYSRLKNAIRIAWSEASDGEKRFLLTHYRLPSRTGSAESVARAAGYADFHQWNSIYGRLGTRVARRTGYSGIHKVMSIVGHAGTNDSAGRVEYQLRRDVARAIRTLKLDSSAVTQRTIDPLGRNYREAVEDQVEADILNQPRLAATEKESLISARRGQGRFRINVAKIEKRCRVTGVSNRSLLRASHIKPWSKSTNLERLDGSNGLLLAPHIDHLFDRGFISFAKTGRMLVSSETPRDVLNAWGVSVPLNVGQFSAQQAKYLHYHRKFVLRK